MIVMYDREGFRLKIRSRKRFRNPAESKPRLMKRCQYERAHTALQSMKRVLQSSPVRPRRPAS